MLNPEETGAKFRFLRFLYIGFYAVHVGIIGAVVGIMVGGEVALYGGIIVGWIVGIVAAVRLGPIKRVRHVMVVNRVMFIGGIGAVMGSLVGVTIIGNEVAFYGGIIVGWIVGVVAAVRLGWLKSPEPSSSELPGSWRSRWDKQ